MREDFLKQGDVLEMMGDAKNCSTHRPEALVVYVTGKVFVVIVDTVDPNHK